MKDFAKRYQQVQRKHQRLAHGYVTRVGRNGVIEHRPRRDVRGLMVTPLVIVVAAFFGFKTLLLSQLGTESYAAHLAALAQGNLAERIGAILMAQDPLTVHASALLSVFI
ncbi:hypothetical protein [Roseivivax sediminis]|nr:hypothetical protein [Roseivivax sediminis]